MSLVQQALANSNLQRARSLLDEHVPGPEQADLRGWEWRYLQAQALGDEFARLRPIDGSV
ncbi:MAG: hypothetical protein GWO24_32230, partial [Akkermansiaceae bacterium]|nr:hypothetical protein [Akkermansiaceae bacterium]